MIKQTKKAFTLIELLVVIAIIGILAGIVIVNLNSARNKGQDTAIKAQANQLVSTSAVYYDDNGYGYSSGPVSAVINSADCSITGSINSSFNNTFLNDANVIKAITGIQRNTGLVPKCSLGANAVKSQSWAVTAKLRNSAGYWCIDSTGTGIEKSNDTIVVSATNEVSCQ